MTTTTEFIESNDEWEQQQQLVVVQDVWRSNLLLLVTKQQQRNKNKKTENNNETEEDQLQLQETWKEQTRQWLEKNTNIEEDACRVVEEIVQRVVLEVNSHNNNDTTAAASSNNNNNNSNNKSSSSSFVFSTEFSFPPVAAAVWNWQEIKRANKSSSREEIIQSLMDLEYLEDITESDWTDICDYLNQQFVVDDDSITNLHVKWYNKMRRQPRQYMGMAMDLAWSLVSHVDDVHNNNTAENNESTATSTSSSSLVVLELWWYIWMDIWTITATDTMTTSQMEFQDKAWNMVHYVWTQWILPPPQQQQQQQQQQSPTTHNCSTIHLLERLDPCGNWFRVWILNICRRPQQQQNAKHSLWRQWMIRSVSSPSSSSTYMIRLVVQCLIVLRASQFPWSSSSERNNSNTGTSSSSNTTTTRIDLFGRLLHLYQNQQQQQQDDDDNDAVASLYEQGLETLLAYAKYQKDTLSSSSSSKQQEEEQEWDQMQSRLGTMLRSMHSDHHDSFTNQRKNLLYQRLAAHLSAHLS